MIITKLKEELDLNNYEFRYSSVIKYITEYYYIYSDIPKIFLNKEARANKLDYYIGIKINIINKYIEIYTEKIVMFVVDKSEIVQVIEENNFNVFDSAVKDIKIDMLCALKSLIDYSSKDGRKILLKNFPCEIAEWMNYVVKEEPSYRFKRKIKHLESAYIDLSKVVGTYHHDYRNKIWLEMFYNLKREGNIIDALLFPEYYIDLQDSQKKKVQISYLKFDDEYFISAGNHRSLLSKMKGLEFIYAPLTEYKTDLEYISYYNKLKELGCKISFPVEEDFYQHGRDYGVEEDWEIFYVTYRGKGKTLIGIDMIREFYNQIKQYKKINLYIKKILNLFNVKNMS